MSDKKREQKKGTDWGAECGRAMGITGKVLLKIVSYFFNILLTVLLISLITGTVVGSVFFYYVKNYIDTDMEEFDMANFNNADELNVRLRLDRNNNVSLYVNGLKSVASTPKGVDLTSDITKKSIWPVTI